VRRALSLTAAREAETLEAPALPEHGESVADAAHEQHQERTTERSAIDRPAGSAPHPILGLQSAIGNRAVARLLRDRALQRAPEIKDVEIKKRFDLPVRHYTQDQVRALYLGSGIVYSGEAVWDEKSKSWIVGRDQVIDLSAGKAEKKDGLPTDSDLERFEHSLDDILRSEPLPETGTSFEVDDFSTAHLNATKAAINYYLIGAYRQTLDEAGEPTKSVLQVTQLAARNVTIARQSSDLRSQSLILRDAQRYFYGRLAAFSNIDMMKSAGSQGADPTLTKDPAVMSEEERNRAKQSPFLDDPDLSNIEKMKQLQRDYEELKKVKKFFGGDVAVTTHPSSAPGGRWWLDKGANDSYNDIKNRRYREKALPYLAR
jgi:hypothetical protein